jgi:hypothetical protein
MIAADDMRLEGYRLIGLSPKALQRHTPYKLQTWGDITYGSWVLVDGRVNLWRNANYRD